MNHKTKTMNHKTDLTPTRSQSDYLLHLAEYYDVPAKVIMREALDIGIGRVVTKLNAIAITFKNINQQPKTSKTL